MTVCVGLYWDTDTLRISFKTRKLYPTHAQLTTISAKGRIVVSIVTVKQTPVNFCDLSQAILIGLKMFSYIKIERNKCDTENSCT